MGGAEEDIGEEQKKEKELEMEEENPAHHETADVKHRPPKSLTQEPSKFQKMKAKVDKKLRRYCWPIYRVIHSFEQQTLWSYKLIITPLPIIIVFSLLGLIMVIIGCFFLGFTFSVRQTKVFRYDNLCPIRATCIFRFELEEDFNDPVFYYHFENFYQNHRRYLKSVSYSQLRGDNVNDYDENEDNCTPAISLDDSHEKKYQFLPCGLIAVSYTAHDVFVLRHDDGSLVNVNHNVAWPSDKTLYDDPGDVQGIRTVQNFENQDYMVWNRVAALPTFSKAWARIKGTMKKGVYRVEITNNQDVHKFDGKKFFFLSEYTWIGGRNIFTGFALLVVGLILIVMAILFTIKQCIRRRKLGDTSYLEWNQKYQKKH